MFNYTRNLRQIVIDHVNDFPVLIIYYMFSIVAARIFFQKRVLECFAYLNSVIKFHGKVLPRALAAYYKHAVRKKAIERCSQYCAQWQLLHKFTGARALLKK